MIDILEISLLVDDKIIIESLTRIGVGNLKEKIIYPSCYLWRNNDCYFLVHFKQLFTLTREKSYNNISEEDLMRRNSIAFCLYNWKLIDLDIEDITPYNKRVFVLPYEEKKNWTICNKFNIQQIYSSYNI